MQEPGHSFKSGVEEDSPDSIAQHLSSQLFPITTHIRTNTDSRTFTHADILDSLFT